MSRKPRIFVGTLYCGEGDYKEACDAILGQRDVDVRHAIIANLPEKEAHNELWRAWRSMRNESDVFVKVDADTVLAHDRVLADLWSMMETNPRITGIQAPLHDYYTDGFINGLNCFSPQVTFHDTTDKLFCDRAVDVDHDIVIKADGVSESLRPAGKHCFSATALQSFHFGVHRSLKGQRDVLARVKTAWELSGRPDDNRMFALLGAEMAPRFTAGGFDYGDLELRKAFEEAFRIRKERLL